jgi:hypothetical protein
MQYLINSSCLAVDTRRSAPRTTSVTCMAASSTCAQALLPASCDTSRQRSVQALDKGHGSRLIPRKSSRNKLPEATQTTLTPPNACVYGQNSRTTATACDAHHTTPRRPAGSLVLRQSGRRQSPRSPCRPRAPAGSDSSTLHQPLFLLLRGVTAAPCTNPSFSSLD